MYIFPKEFFSNRIFVQGFANLRNFFQRKVFPIIFFPKEFFSKKVVKSRTFFQPHFLLLKLFPKEFFLTEIVSKGTNPQKQEIFSKSFYLNVNFFPKKSLTWELYSRLYPQNNLQYDEGKTRHFFPNLFSTTEVYSNTYIALEFFSKETISTGTFFQRQDANRNFFPKEKFTLEFFSIGKKSKGIFFQIKIISGTFFQRKNVKRNLIQRKNFFPSSKLPLNNFNSALQFGLNVGCFTEKNKSLKQTNDCSFTSSSI